MVAIQIAAYALFLMPQGEVQDLWERLSFYANGRLRGESTFDQLNGKDRHRGRMRFRIGARYRITDSLRADARLSSASDGRDANNPYWDFGDGSDGFEGIETVFDRFFLSWDATETIELRAGKFPHVFSSPPVYGEFVWDDDVHPAGLTAVWAPGTEGDWRCDLRLAGYDVTENSSDDDATMFGLQANLACDAGENTTLAVASGLQWWSDLDDGSFDNQGNTTNASGQLDQDFTVWESFVSGAHDGGWLGRQTGFVQYMNNIEDDSGDDTGITLGLELGRKDPGQASFFAAWYDLDANAIFSPVAQDDTPIAGTGTDDGMKGVLGGVRYVVNDRLAFRLWGLTSDADDAEDPWRLRLDLDFNVK